MAEVKGHAIISCKNYLTKRFSDKDLLKLKDVLSENNYNILFHAEGEKEYPLNDFIEINKAICKIFSDGNTNILREIGRQSATDAVKGVLKAFFKFGSPQFIMKLATEVFSKYYNTGKLIYVESTKNSVVADLQDFKIDNKEDMEFICKRVEGWIERSIEISAGKGMKTIQTKCMAKGDESCMFYTEWQN